MIEMVNLKYVDNQVDPSDLITFYSVSRFSRVLHTTD